MNKVLYTTCYLILRPLIRILLRKGVSYGEFTQIAKQAYVKVAEEAAITPTCKKPTTSQIAITTGLTRKDVAALRKVDFDEVTITARYNRGTRVIDGWLHDSDFNHGNPTKTLPLLGTECSFKHLVERYSGDMPYRAMLQELARVQAVEVSADDRSVRLLTDAYVPYGDEDEKLAILGKDVSHLITTIDYNLSADKTDLRYQRQVSYDNLPIEALAPFKKMVRQDSQALLVKFNEWLSTKDRDRTPESEGTGKVKAGVGIYYFEEDNSQTNNK